MVRIDQPETSRLLKILDDETDAWQLYSTRQTANSGDYWREANNLSSICE